MDLALNLNASFTKWAVNAGLLAEAFVLVDVGVQRGESVRWHALGDHLTVHGFDAIAEVIDELKKKNARYPNRHYHLFAAGNADGDAPFYYNAVNPTSSSMYQQGQNRFGIHIIEELRTVPMRRLDSLFAAGLLPKTDFLKVDVEGFEKEVLLGTRELLRAGMLGMQVETNFGISTIYPASHFAAVAEIALDYDLLVFDIAFDRIPRASFQKALARKGLKPISRVDAVGKPAAVDVLFCRDAIDESDHRENYRTQSRPFDLDQLIKLMIIYELHGLNDIALDTADRFADRLGTRLDVDRAIWLLADPDCRSRAVRPSFQQCMHGLGQSVSWRAAAAWRRLRGFTADVIRD